VAERVAVAASANASADVAGAVVAERAAGRLRRRLRRPERTTALNHPVILSWRSGEAAKRSEGPVSC
jgi:hypothetical protein